MPAAVPANPYLLGDPFRIHDEAMARWLGTPRVDYGEIDGTARDNVPVVVVFASPDRAVAEFGKMLLLRGWVTPVKTDGVVDEDATERKLQGLNLPDLPLISVSRTGWSEDKELAGGPKTFYQKQYNYLTGAWDAYQWPTTYRADYTVVVWSKFGYTQRHLLSWFESQLNKPGAAQGETYIPVVHPDPIGTINQSLRRTGMMDASDLEGSGRRNVRTNLSFSLRMLVYRKPENNGAVVRVDMNVDRIDTLTGDGGAEVLIPVPDPTPARPSANHFVLPSAYSPVEYPVKWPKVGNATVRLVADDPRIVRPTLRVTAAQTSDAVLIAKGRSEANPLAVLRWWLNARADANGVDFVVEQADADGSNLSTVARVPVADSSATPRRQWRQFRGCALLDRPVFGAHVEGGGAASSTVDLTDVHLYTYAPEQGAAIPPSAVRIDGLSIVADWSGLAPGSYFLCAGGFGGFLDALRVFAVTDADYAATTAPNEVTYDPAYRPSAVIPFTPPARGGLVSLRIVSDTPDAPPPTPSTLCAIPYRLA